MYTLTFWPKLKTNGGKLLLNWDQYSVSQKKCNIAIFRLDLF